jgi:hypothetical protein
VDTLLSEGLTASPNAARTGINGAVKGNTRTAYGCQWRYAEN